MPTDPGTQQKKGQKDCKSQRTMEFAVRLNLMECQTKNVNEEMSEGHSIPGEDSLLPINIEQGLSWSLFSSELLTVPVSSAPKT